MNNIPVILVDNFLKLGYMFEYLEKTIFQFHCTPMTFLYMVMTVFLVCIAEILVILERTKMMLINQESILVMLVNILV
jgi:hypothetical protein